MLFSPGRQVLVGLYWRRDSIENISNEKSASGKQSDRYGKPISRYQSELLNAEIATQHPHHSQTSKALTGNDQGRLSVLARGGFQRGQVHLDHPHHGFHGFGVTDQLADIAWHNLPA